MKVVFGGVRGVRVFGGVLPNKPLEVMNNIDVGAHSVRLEMLIPNM